MNNPWKTSHCAALTLLWFWKERGWPKELAKIICTHILDNPIEQNVFYNAKEFFPIQGKAVMHFSGGMWVITFRYTGHGPNDMRYIGCAKTEYCDPCPKCKRPNCPKH